MTDMAGYSSDVSIEPELDYSSSEEAEVEARSLSKLTTSSASISSINSDDSVVCLEHGNVFTEDEDDDEDKDEDDDEDKDDDEGKDEDKDDDDDDEDKDEESEEEDVESLENEDHAEVGMKRRNAGDNEQLLLKKSKSCGQDEDEDADDEDENKKSLERNSCPRRNSSCKRVTRTALLEMKWRLRRQKEHADENFKLGEYITREYGILRLVFSYLPISDLRNAAKVCRSWEAAAEVTKQSRTRLECLLWRHRAKGHSMVTYLRREFKTRIYSESMFCMVFVSGVPSPPLPKHRIKGVANIIMEPLHPDCAFLAIQSHGVIGETPRTGRVLEIENEYPAFSGVLFPNIPGVGIYPFMLCEGINLTATGKQKNMEFMTSNEPVSCLLLFASETCSRNPVVGNTLNYFRKRWGTSVAIGGGVMERHQLFNGTSSHPDALFGEGCLVGVVFTGRNVTSYSLVVKRSVRTGKEVEAALKKFAAEQEQTCDQSIGFMFACLGRGHNLHRRLHVESQAFKRVFPNTPLVGYFGNGEIGVNSVPEKLPPMKGETSEKPLTERQYLYAYSTVFVRVCFKKGQLRS